MSKFYRDYKEAHTAAVMLAEYHLEVYGYLWSGAKSVYSYQVDTGIALALADRTRKYSDDDAAKCAGDFSSLIDWRVVKHTFEYERTRSPPITRRIDTYRTLRGFRNGMTPQRFYRLANG